MTSNGEQAPRIGEQFRNSAIALVESLGYREVFSGNHGLDFVAKTPSRRGRFRRPCFSPEGLTAFEFTADGSVNVKKRSKRLKDCIKAYNDAFGGNQNQIVGGVLILDTKIGKSNIRKHSNNQIFCWDHRHLSFLTAKCRWWSDWVPMNRRLISPQSFKERLIESMITSFEVIEPMRGFNDVFFGVFHHSPTAVLSVSDVHKFLPKVFRPIKTHANNNALPTVLHVQMHVAGEIERGLLYDFVKVLTEYVDDFVSLAEDSCHVYYYNCAPWASYIPEIE